MPKLRVCLAQVPLGGACWGDRGSLTTWRCGIEVWSRIWVLCFLGPPTKLVCMSQHLRQFPRGISVKFRSLAVVIISYRQLSEPFQLSPLPLAMTQKEKAQKSCPEPELFLFLHNIPQSDYKLCRASLGGCGPGAGLWWRGHLLSALETEPEDSAYILYPGADDSRQGQIGKMVTPSQAFAISYEAQRWNFVESIFPWMVICILFLFRAYNIS